MQLYLNEDKLTDFIKNNNGIIWTRTLKNIETFNFDINQNILAILTGYNHIINHFFNNIVPKIKKKFILILIESDIINITKTHLDNPKLIHCFTWNKPFIHYKLSSLPIGLNYRRQHESIITFIKNNKINETNIIERPKLLCFNCDLKTNIERKRLLKIINKRFNTFCEKLNYIPYSKTITIPSFADGKIVVNITDPKCYDDWTKYKFILSPQGAGVDCHRTWEAIIIGCIPIVKSSSINDLYKDLPIVVINNWEELSIEFLEKKYKEINENKIKNKYNYQKLYLKYWETKILNKLRNIHFITFGDNNFKRAKQRLLKEAQLFNEFDSITGYGPEDLSLEFKEKFKDILLYKRGAGYWIWRMEIIKKKLKEINENDFIVYLDSGCKLNNQGKKRFYEYFDMFDNSDNLDNYGILSFQMHNQLEKWWTTKEILKYFNVEKNKEILESGQYLKTIVILRKNDHSRKLVEEFEKCINFDKFLITDKYNENQDKYFKDNRHDQSISSIIRKKIGNIVIPKDESYIIPFGKGESLKYPFWATRSRK